MQKTIFTILTVVFLSVPLVGQEAALPESTQPDSTEIGSFSEKEQSLFMTTFFRIDDQPLYDDFSMIDAGPTKRMGIGLNYTLF